MGKKKAGGSPPWRSPHRERPDCGLVQRCRHRDGPGRPAAIPAEYIQWMQFGKAWRPSAQIGIDETSAGVGASDQRTAATPDVLVMVDRGRGLVDHADHWPA